MPTETIVQWFTGIFIVLRHHICLDSSSTEAENEGRKVHLFTEKLQSVVEASVEEYLKIQDTVTEEATVYDSYRKLHQSL